MIYLYTIEYSLSLQMPGKDYVTLRFEAVDSARVPCPSPLPSIIVVVPRTWARLGEREAMNVFPAPWLAKVSNFSKTCI